ncbi:MAG: excinuclease ABC subunit A [Parcubacteria group bacterium RIFCSPLOWO2_01_FULL_48_18]|nr:MAG: excinuclease ABC subunit A [Parcubacteria group bacterium RIFCSPHIGHO2_02_FULL_48_10b]OHB22568.1 MAG: excinuclease ABC subunit A [Parcubacteria group bacterium RIFCSPLOWO2_01_FULL_48_18]
MSITEKIIIKGARVHNLKNIGLELPKNRLIVFTGLSGSGKSSLAFDTIFAEGQRRYIESLSPYARQFLGQMEKPDVDDIEGLSPAISIDQKAHSHNPRSTVATLTEIYDYLRVLFARIGKPHCPICGRVIHKMSVEEMVETIQAKSEERKGKSEYAMILAPVVRGRKGEYFQLLQDLFMEGFGEVRIDGKFHSLHERIELGRYKMHTIEAVVDKLAINDRPRLFEAVETALDKGKGLVNVIFDGPNIKTADVQKLRKVRTSDVQNIEAANELLLSSHWTCPHDDFAFPEIEPRLFSFNSPYGACEACSGIGHDYFDPSILCETCKGKRLKNESLAVKIRHQSIADLSALTIDKAYEFFGTLEAHLNESEKIIASNLLKEIVSRLEFLLEVGLDYITLDREAGTLSGGESQRIRLASQIGSKLSGTLYVLDEPTIGLHERDNERLLKILKNLRDLGNTVIMVEHDERAIRESDYLVDIGPGPGRRGGEIVAVGPIPEALKAKKEKSLTLQYLNGSEKIEIPQTRRTKNKGWLGFVGAHANNINNLNFEIPLGRLVCVTGVSGSGKSTLLENIVYKNLQLKLGRFGDLEHVAKVTGVEYISRVVEVDQSPIGRTPRSNPATYTGVFAPIRDLFSMLPASRERGYRPGRFSFNVRPAGGGGRCEACEGAGAKIVKMHFLPDVLVKCDVCRGKRFNSETLQVQYKGKHIAEVLDMTAEDAHELFEGIFTVADKLKVMREVGLDYIKLGQSATTLSGGEAQRIKLSKELARPLARNTVFILDEPTTGLHYHDVKMLLRVLDRLVEKGNTVLLIEHNMHVIKTADYIIDMGPEGGGRGGKIIATGTPEEIAKNRHSYTGRYLKGYLTRKEGGAHKANSLPTRSR